jgi:hypothetical protein
MTATITNDKISTAQEWLDIYGLDPDSHSQRVSFALAHGFDPRRHTRCASERYTRDLCEVDTAIFLHALRWRRRANEISITLIRDLATHAPTNVRALIRITVNDCYGLAVDPADTKALTDEPIVIVPPLRRGGESTPFINGHDMHRLWLSLTEDGVEIRTMTARVTVADESSAEQWIRENMIAVEPATNVSEGTGADD